MEIIKYNRKYSEVTKFLYNRNILVKYPDQVRRDDLKWDEGIDIVYKLRNLTPAKFAEYSDFLLLAAQKEAERYPEAKLRFAKFAVVLNRTAKGRKTIGPRREYIAAKHPESDIMVYGEEALGYELPEEYTKKPFLVNKVEEILSIPDTRSPGAFIEKQKPYKVVEMVISLRGGLKRSERVAQLKERELLKKEEDLPAIEEGKGY